MTHSPPEAPRLSLIEGPRCALGRRRGLPRRAPLPRCRGRRRTLAGRSAKARVAAEQAADHHHHRLPRRSAIRAGPLQPALKRQRDGLKSPREIDNERAEQEPAAGHQHRPPAQPASQPASGLNGEHRRGQPNHHRSAGTARCPPLPAAALSETLRGRTEIAKGDRQWDFAAAAPPLCTPHARLR